MTGGLATQGYLTLLAGCGILAATAVAMAREPDALQAAAHALDVTAIKTLRFTGSGATFTVGQNFTPADPWPRVTLRSFTASIDFDRAGMQLDLVRDMGATMPRGGGVPFTGELRQTQALVGGLAWDVPHGSDPSAGAMPTMPCTAPEAGGTAPQAAPAPASTMPCLVTLWTLTPHGFIKAAIANHATVAHAGDGFDVSFVVGGTYTVKGRLNARHQVERVQTWIDQSIVGDMLVETEYRDYKDFGEVRFPSHIVQTQDGFPALDITVTGVHANAPITITVPDRTAPSPQSVEVKVQQLADGVFWLTGGTHHSLAIAMQDHIVLVDTPNGEARASAVLAKAKEVIPGKPIRYVIAMHHHWDHMGGIRTAIDEGATIVTHESNRALIERAADAPHTINPDRLARSKKTVTIQTVGAEGQLTDGTRTVKLYLMTGFDHTSDMLMVYLPKEKILAEADAYTPPETPTSPLIAPKIPYAAALYDNVRRLNLDVATIVPFHGMRTADMMEVARQANNRK